VGQNEDAVWREIVANYGDRPDVEPDQETRQADRPPVRDDEQVELAAYDDSVQERFVPPPPPPLPHPPKDRLAAWAGVFVAPALLLLMTLLRVDVPTIVAWVLVGGFLGGFGYLVAQMPRGPRDPFDDGARL
jgi:hypothetical protein